jgi:predicted TIM-barrel fold metal-dependent hydrolase
MMRWSNMPHITVHSGEESLSNRPWWFSANWLATPEKSRAQDDGIIKRRD